MATIEEKKVLRINTVQTWATMFGGLDDWLETLNAQEFDFGQVNEPTDDDLAVYGITRDDFRNLITLLKKVENVTKAVAVAVQDHLGVIARVRTDAQ